MASSIFQSRAELLEKIGSSFDESLMDAVTLVVDSVNKEGVLYFVGNGGSAAEAQHMSAEYIATLDRKNFRNGIRSHALTVDTSFLTAWTNDFGYDEVFSRQLETLGRYGDVLFAYSTSGSSKNVVRCGEVAKLLGIRVIGFTGEKEGDLSSLSDVCFRVPSNKTALIQEIHTMLGHSICAEVERLTQGEWNGE